MDRNRCQTHTNNEEDSATVADFVLYSLGQIFMLELQNCLSVPLNIRIEISNFILTEMLANTND